MDWSSILISQFWAVPFFLIYFVGFLFAVIGWSRHPQVSCLALAAFVLFLTSLVTGVSLHVWVASVDRDLEAADIGKIYAVATMIRTAIDSLGWILLLVALFGWRSTNRAS